MCFLCPLSPGVPWCFTQERSGTAGMDVGDVGRAHPADSDGAAPALFAQPLMPGGGSPIIPIPSPLWALFRSRHPKLASCIPLSIWKRSPLGTRMSQGSQGSIRSSKEPLLHCRRTFQQGACQGGFFSNHHLCKRIWFSFPRYLFIRRCLLSPLQRSSSVQQVPAGGVGSLGNALISSCAASGFGWFRSQGMEWRRSCWEELGPAMWGEWLGGWRRGSPSLQEGSSPSTTLCSHWRIHNGTLKQSGDGCGLDLEAAPSAQSCR